MWFIHFAVFRVHEYRFNAYILPIIVQSRFLFYSQFNFFLFIAFYDKLTFVLQIRINIFRPIKMKIKVLGYLVKIIFSSIIIMTWLNCCKLFLVILICWYKRYSICPISSSNLYELFPAFIFANNVGRLVSNSLFGVKTFNPVPSFFLFFSFNSFWLWFYFLFF